MFVLGVLEYSSLVGLGLSYCNWGGAGVSNIYQNPVVSCQTPFHFVVFQSCVVLNKNVYHNYYVT